MDQRLFAEIGEIYEAVTDPARWQSFLDLFAQRYPESGVYLWLEDKERVDVSVGSSAGADSAFVESHTAHYASVNPWVGVVSNLPVGSIHTGKMLLPESETLNSEFYVDWMKPQGFRTAYGTNLLKSERHHMFFSALLHESLDAGPNDLRLLRLLFPHLQRAARLYLQFAAVQQRSEALETMLDEVPLGCVLLDAGRKVAFTNGLAGRLTTEGDGLEIRHGRLTASHRANSENLEREIAAAFALAEGKGLAPNGVLALPRPSGKPPYIIYLVPIGLHTPDPALSLGLSLPAVAVFINDPSRQAVTPQAVIQGHYRLTPAEARLAFAFLQTASLKNAAEHCAITEASARQYLKRIFQKTETSSQPQLMKLLLSHIVGR